MDSHTPTIVPLPSPPSLLGKGAGGLGLRAGIRENCCVFLFILIAIFPAARAATSQPPPDISEELAKARKAADDGDRLGSNARLAAADAKADDSMKLFNAQAVAYNDAQSAFREALAKDSRNPRGLAEYAQFWFARRHFVQARYYCERTLEIFTIAASAKPKMSDLEKEERDSCRAELVSFSAEDKAEFQCEVLRMLGAALERAGESEHAVACYSKGLTFFPADAKTRIALGIALCANGRPQEVATVLKGWADEAGKVPDLPKQPELRALGAYTLAVAQEETGYYEDALSSYLYARKLALQAGEAESAGVFDNATLAVERLQDFFDDIKDHDAKREKENIERKKNHQEPLIGEREQIASAHYRLDEGLKFKDQALKDASFVEALAASRYDWGGSDDRDPLKDHASWDSFDTAMKWFQSALQAAPRVHQAAYQSALCQIMAGHFTAARTLLEESAAASPYNLATLNEQGSVLLELGQWEESAAVFKKILALDPDSGFANFGLARALAALQRDENECRSALDALDRVERLGYRDPRMIHSQNLIRKDGSEFAGVVKESGDHYSVKQGPESVINVPKADVLEVLEHASLREDLEATVERFERGERPPTPMKLRHKNKPRNEGANPVWDRGMPDLERYFKKDK